MKNKLDKIYKKARKIAIDNQSKLVIMSDCHRGIGNKNDNFLENKYIYKKALTYYDKKQFTYIELGDGDELWEVKNYEKIKEEYNDIFKLIKKFHDKKRFIMIYGNHDICKKSKTFIKKHFEKEKDILLKELTIREAIVLDYLGYEIFLVHGHQVDFLNSTLWRLSRFAVRYIWSILEFIGIKDPTGPIKNHKVTKKVDKKLNNWSKKNQKIVIAGHTHKPVYPKVGDSMYFNDGSCVHPDGITCLEIENGKLTLVKWSYQIKENKLIVERKKILKEENIENFCNKKK